MKRPLRWMGLIGVFIVTALLGQLLFAPPANAIADPNFNWNDAYTDDEKLSDNQLNWCNANLNNETVADINSYRSGASGGQYVNDCLNSARGGICTIDDEGDDDEYVCVRDFGADTDLDEKERMIRSNESTFLQVLYCGPAGNAQNADRLVPCYQAVKAAYQSPRCYYRNQTNYNDGYSTTKYAAPCVFQALRNNDTMINRGVLLTEVKSAIRKGKKQSNQELQQAATNEVSRQECLNDGGEWSDDTCVTEDGEAATTTCAIDNIGWIVCPVLGFMAKIIDGAYNQVADWLTVAPLATTGSSTGPITMYSAWNIMRNLANVAFVIGFMLIIYSQLTSVGISNYGVKKLLPKIAISAILVNVSFWICAVAVDVSNIAGSSLHSLFDPEVFAAGLDTSGFASTLSSTGNGWTGIVSAILAGTLLYAALPALLVALPAALFAIVTVFLVLALRQVLIILLVVISPLAFVALLLPNTEDWFKKWRTLFQTLLLLYPIIALIFGASAMASTIVMNSAVDAEGDGEIALQLMGALITILPLAITPLVLKFGGGVLSRFGGMINNPNKGPFDAMRKRTDALAGRMQNRRIAGSIKRGQKFGKFVRNSSVGRSGAAASAYLQDGIKGDGSSKVRSSLAERYSRVASRATNGIEFAASMGNTGKVDAAERDKYAKIAADGAARDYVAERAVQSKEYAASLAGGDPRAATLVQAYGKQAVHEEEIKDVKAQRVLIDGYSVEQLIARAQDSGASVSERAAAVQEIAERGGHQHVQQMYDYLMTAQDEGIGDIQKLSAEAMLRRKPAGMSATTANNMKSGTMRGDGFMNEFQSRFEAGKFSAEAISNMDLDDHIRIAEMASRGELTDAALMQLSNQLTEIEASDTMKLSPEQTKILTEATYRRVAINPNSPSGRPYSLQTTLPVRPKPTT